MNKEELDEILRKHKLWLGNNKGEIADLEAIGIQVCE